MYSQLLQVATVGAAPDYDPNFLPLDHTVAAKQEQILHRQAAARLATPLAKAGAASTSHPISISRATKQKPKASTTLTAHPPTDKEMQAFQQSLKDNTAEDGVPRSRNTSPLLSQKWNKNSPPTPAIGPVATPLGQWAQNGSSSNISLTSQQLGLSGPLNGGVTYNSVTGVYLNAQYILPLSDQLALGLLGEYGASQFRLNATVGYGLSPLSQIKVSAEYLAQRLPFQFDSGTIMQRVHQLAYGVRFQHLFEQPYWQNINLGGYYANAASKDLSPVIFTENGLNYLNERRIAGASSAGIDVGTEVLLSPKTSLDGNVYFDRVRYDTQLTGDTSHNRQGLGVGVKLGQLFGGHFKLWAEASVRQIYDSYGGGVSWLPTPKLWGVELSVVGQHVVSHDGVPNSNSVGLQLQLFPDANAHYDEYFDWQNKHLSSVSQWVQTPAVYMNQVLAVAEQTTRLLSPLIASVNPNNGPAAGGNTVTITGSNFVDGLKLFFGGKLASGTALLSTTTLTVKVPSVAGTAVSKPVDVIIENPDGQQATLNNGYTYNSSPSITNIVPPQGPTAGGTSVRIMGKAFTGATAVTFDGETAAIQSATATEITVSTPQHEAGAVDVVVTSPDGSATATKGYTYVAAPTVSGVSPPSGPTAGGTQVTITGKGFTGATAVTFGGQTATIQSGATDSKITVSAPAHVAGAVDVVVTTPDGSGSKAGGYTYVAAPTITDISPASGSTMGGTTVTITGKGFAGGITAVTFDGEIASTQSATATEITVLTPGHANPGAVHVVVTTPGGQSSPATYTYVAAPTITDISPASGSTMGGTAVMITGTGFVGGGPDVTFDGEEVRGILSLTPTKMTVSTPPRESEFGATVDVVVKTPYGSYTKVNGYTYVKVQK